ncbi:MAG TPA: hypothetical protein VHA53_03280 [Nitrolancea sp.]|nr:hypothetical protein [Nitrolancea sp.]
MYEIRFNDNASGRVWQGELPALEYDPLRVMHRRYPAPAIYRTRPGCAAIEVRLGPPRDLTGTLGARFMPDSSTSLCVQLMTSDDNGGIVEWALAQNSDVLRMGLPEEYVDGLFKGIDRSTHREKLGGGMLRFDRTALSMTNSAPVVFGWLAEAVIYLLTLGDAPADVRELHAFFFKKKE